MCPECTHACLCGAAGCASWQAGKRRALEFTHPARTLAPVRERERPACRTVCALMCFFCAVGWHSFELGVYVARPISVQATARSIEPS
jgi:hypothetical protein